MITKSAFDDKAFINNLTFTKSARSAWQLILNSSKKQNGQVNALLPAYIGFTDREGSGIFDPILNTGVKYSFYEINEDLSINLDSLKEFIKTGQFNLLLVVHYFGFCRNNMEQIKDLCKKNEIILVEDCAHAFQLGIGKEHLGIWGDFSFYSVHKYLPVDSGGILKNLSKKIPLLALPKSDQISLEPALQLLKSDYEAIKEKRISNFNLYKNKLTGVKGLEVMYDLKDGEIPQTFAVRIKNNLREPLYFYLMDKDMPTIALYYRLIDVLENDKYLLPNLISKEILNLPVHQDTHTDDINALVKEIKLFLAAKK